MQCRTHAEINRNAGPFSRRAIIYVEKEKLRHLDHDVCYTLPSSFTNFCKVCRAKRLAETCLATAIYLQLNVPTEYIAFFFHLCGNVAQILIPFNLRAILALLVLITSVSD